MKLAIMQPYFFPYIGYFQLVKAVDKFIFYDDVNYIKGGWINRNLILVNNKPHLISLMLSGASSNNLIKEISVAGGVKKITKTIEQYYARATYFEPVYELFVSVINPSVQNQPISIVSAKSIVAIANYLNIQTAFEYSSRAYGYTKLLERTDRLIEICHRNRAEHYINASGGKSLYSKDYFDSKGVKLSFIQNNIGAYKQFSGDFVPGLSIIDVMMFNSPEQINNMLDNYEFE